MKQTTIKKVNVGSCTFGDRVDICDPCYDRNAKNFGDLGLRDVAVVPGKYFGTAELYPDEIWNGKQYYRVSALQMSLNGDIYNTDSFDYFGDVAVDAGLMGIYQAPHHHYESDTEWEEFCNLLHNKDWLELDNGLDIGFVSSSGYGDGCYPVLGVWDEDDPDRLVAIRIEFITDEEEEEVP